MSNLNKIFAYFSKCMELDSTLTVDDIKQTNDFNKLTLNNQKELENLLNEKYCKLKELRKN